MKHLLLLFTLFNSIGIFSQETESDWKKYQSVDYMLLFNPNSNKDQYFDYNTNKWVNPTKFILAGVAAQYEYGIAYKEWIRLGALTGFYANVGDKSYSIPIVGSITLAPLISDETRIYAKFGYGWNTAIGRGNLNSDFHHYHIGIEFGGGSRLFLFASDHGFRLKGEVYKTLGIGFGGTLFNSKK
ncbi:MAG TPA: hypothetical protein VKY32_07845 [Flavobacterium sp.]|nr:hypothetical protein [Flavobacterium sp.]